MSALESIKYSWMFRHQLHLIDIASQTIIISIGESTVQKTLQKLHQYVFSPNPRPIFNGIIIKSCDILTGCEWCDDSDSEGDNSIQGDPIFVHQTRYSTWTV